MTEILSTGEIEKCVSLLRKGGVIAYPSESSYGIGCDFENDDAKNRIYEIKNRPESKRFIVLTHSAEIMKKYSEISEKAGRLSRIPGLTLVVPSRDGTIAFRVTTNDFARSLCEKFGKPVVSTSANLSGEEPIYEIEKIKKGFAGKVDAIVDAGDLPRNPLSTVYDVSSDTVLREGAVSRGEIEAA